MKILSDSLQKEFVCFERGRGRGRGRESEREQESKTMTAVSKLSISSVTAANNGNRRTITVGAEPANENRRRMVLLSSVALASTAAVIPEASDSKKALLQKYLKRSEENKAKNDKVRLDDYYKRNYKNYLEFIEGSVKGKTELSESEKGLFDWLKANKMTGMDQFTAPSRI